MPKYRNEYKYHSRISGMPEHIYTCIGAKGAVHFHITEVAEVMPQDPYSGGLEFHYRQPPEYMKDNAPGTDKCWLLNAPCWHDGTSLYAHETLIPFWLSNPNDHERIFRRLEFEYERTFNGAEDE